MISIGIDLGSSHLGAVVADDVHTSLDVQTLAVDPEHVERTVDALLDLAQETAAERFIVEYQEWFTGKTPVGLSPADAARWAARAVATQRTWTVGHDLYRDLCRRSTIPVRTIARQTWAHRVCPHHRAVTDQDVREGLAAIVGAETVAELDVHQRDALGAILGVLLEPPPKAPKLATPRPKRPRRARGGAARRAAARAAAGCTCTTRRHQPGCPLAHATPLASADPALGTKYRAVLDFLAEHPDATMREIATAVWGDGSFRRQTAARMLLVDLQRRGFVTLR